MLVVGPAATNSYLPSLELVAGYSDGRPSFLEQATEFFRTIREYPALRR